MNVNFQNQQKLENENRVNLRLKIEKGINNGISKRSVQNIIEDKRKSRKTK